MTTIWDGVSAHAYVAHVLAAFQILKSILTKYLSPYKTQAGIMHIAVVSYG